MDNLIYLALVLALGNISRKLPHFPTNTAQVLNIYVIWISLPATILLQLNGFEFETDLLILALIPWMILALSVVAVVFISRALDWDRPLTGGVMLAVTLGNTSFFGFPAILAFLGEKYLGYAIIYDQVGTFLALVTFGTIVVSVYGNGSAVSPRAVIRKILGFPPFVALMIGLALANTTIPSMAMTVLNGLSATLIPLVTFSVGAQLKFRQPLSNIKPIAITMFLKMIVSPAVAMVILLLMGIGGPVFKVAVFEAGMPSMVMAGILAAAGNLRPDIANAAIGYGIIFSFATLPVLSWLVQQFSG